MKSPDRMKTEDRSFFIELLTRSGSFNMVQNHSHNSYEIYYMKEGSRYYFIKDRSYLVREGDLVLIEPMVLHRTTEAYSPVHSRVLINFTADWIGGMLTEMPEDLLITFRDHPVVRPEGKDKIWVDHLISRLLTEREQQEPGTTGYMKLLITELLLWLYRHAKQASNQELHHAEHPTTLHRKVSEIVQHINDKYEEELTLQTVADRFHISPYYLCRIFKEATGFTVIEYIQRLRVREAQNLLRATRLSMTEVAGRVGFDSSTHFGRVFKTVCGVSPLQYRKSAISDAQG